MVLLVHTLYQDDDFLIEKLKPFATKVIKDVRVAKHYAYLLPEDFEGHPANAAIKNMKGIKL